MTQTTEDKLKSYSINTATLEKEKVLRKGSALLFQQQLNHHSFKNLFLFTVQFIKLRTWFLQFLILGLAALPITIYQWEQTTFTTMMNSYLLLLLFSLVFFAEEISRSFTFGVWELEQTFKYDLRQHILVKLIIFGSLDLTLIFCVALFTNLFLGVSFIKIALYLLVPFNLFSILLLTLLTHLRNNRQQFFLWFITGALAASSLIIASLFNIYDLSMHYWLLGLIVTSIFLLGAGRQQIKQLTQEVV